MHTFSILRSTWEQTAADNLVFTSGKLSIHIFAVLDVDKSSIFLKFILRPIVI